MNLFSRLTYNDYLIDGEVNERLPLYTKNLKDVYPLDKDINNLFPTLEIRAINNTPTIVHGNQEMVKAISNITAKNGLLNFSGQADSYIELNKALLDIDSFEIEIKFRIDDFSNKERALFTSKSNNIDLSLVVDNATRYIYSEMTGLQGPYNTKPDLNNKAYTLTDSGAINKSIWYELKFVKYKGIIVVYLNDIKTKALIAEGDINHNSLFIGQKNSDVNTAFKGDMEYIRFRKIEKFPETERCTLHTNSLYDSFSVSYEWTPTLLSTYDLINLDTLKVKLEQNNLKIFNGSTALVTKQIVEDRRYYICHSYNRSNNKMRTLIYDMTTHTIIYNDENDITISNNTNQIDVVLNNTLFKLCVYKEALKETSMLGNCSKRLSLTKDGNLTIDIDEENNMKLRNDNGTKYHFRLGYDLNSDCGTITSKDKVFSTHGGVKSGIYNADIVMDLIPFPEDAVITSEMPWDKNLHHKTYSINGWTTGCNSGVDNPSVGYHAKWIREGLNKNQIMLRFTNCNAQFNQKNRWLGSNKSINADDLWRNCKAGDKIGVAFKARTDHKGIMQMGFYRPSKTTGENGFYNNLTNITIEDSNWKDYWYECTIDQDWDLTKNAYLYLYGNFTEGSTIDVETISLTKNGKKVPYDVMTDSEDRKIKLSFSKAINLDYSQDWHVIYQTKMYDLSLGNHFDSLGQQIYWGVENNKFIFNCGSTKLTYDEIDVNKLMSEWITISLSHIGDKTRLTIYTKLGVFFKEITGNLPQSLFNSQFNYDLMLGGKDNVTTGCAIYKDLSLVKGWYVGNSFVENMFRTKLSYYNNTLLSNVDITESSLS